MASSFLRPTFPIQSIFSDNQITFNEKKLPCIKSSSEPNSDELQAMKKEDMEIRICTSKACRKDGSLSTFDLFKGLSPPNVNVEVCGCLGKCGSGPNLVLLPKGLIVTRCYSPNQIAKFLENQCGAAEPQTNLLALEFKNEGIRACDKEDWENAENIFSKAIELQPSGSLHDLYCKRSTVRLKLKKMNAALEDAEKALKIKSNYADAYMCLADVHVANSDWMLALETYGNASSMDKELLRSKKFQRKLRQVQTNLGTNMKSN